MERPQRSARSAASGTRSYLLRFSDGARSGAPAVDPAVEPPAVERPQWTPQWNRPQWSARSGVRGTRLRGARPQWLTRFARHLFQQGCACTRGAHRRAGVPPVMVMDPLQPSSSLFNHGAFGGGLCTHESFGAHGHGQRPPRLRVGCARRRAHACWRPCRRRRAPSDERDRSPTKSGPRIARPPC